jgi:hypothetical protein
MSTEMIDKVRFVICDSCFWCASLLGNGVFFSRCPSCQSNNSLESIPVANREKYRSDYDYDDDDDKSRIVLEFA